MDQSDGSCDHRQVPSRRAAVIVALGPLPYLTPGSFPQGYLRQAGLSSDGSRATTSKGCHFWKLSPSRCDTSDLETSIRGGAPAHRPRTCLLEVCFLARPSIRSGSAAAGHRFTEWNGCGVGEMADGFAVGGRRWLSVEWRAALPPCGGFCYTTGMNETPKPRRRRWYQYSLRSLSSSCSWRASG